VVPEAIALLSRRRTKPGRSVADVAVLVDEDVSGRSRLPLPYGGYQAAALNRSARASMRSRVMSNGVRTSHHGDTALRGRERN
jgi:hypothetical protein